MICNQEHMDSLLEERKQLECDITSTPYRTMWYDELKSKLKKLNYYIDILNNKR